MDRMNDDKFEFDTPQSVFYRGRKVRRTKCYSFEKTHITQARIFRLQRSRKQPKRRAK
jgi:hypothetical protein